MDTKKEENTHNIIWIAVVVPSSFSSLKNKTRREREKEKGRKEAKEKYHL